MPAAPVNPRPPPPARRVALHAVQPAPRSSAVTLEEALLRVLPSAQHGEPRNEAGRINRITTNA